MANKELGNTLREYRVKKNLRQQDVADILGLKNKSTLGSWEVGKSEPNAETFLKLCNLYGICDLSKVFLGIETQPCFDISNMETDERYIIEHYRNMNSEGQKYLLQTVDAIYDRYKKDDSLPDMEAADIG